MNPPEGAFASALLLERARLHRAIVPTSAGASLIAAAVVAWVLHRHGVPASTLMAWAGVLGTAMLMRAGVALMQGRDADRRLHARSWLWCHRTAFFAHGLAWAFLSVRTMPGLDHEGFDLLLFAVAAMTAGSLIATAFDIKAALAFAAPALAPATVHLFKDEAGAETGMGALLGLFIAFSVLSTVRAQRVVYESVRLRMREAEKAEEAERHAAAAELARAELAEQHHLLGQLMRNTRQGYWFIDNNGMTTDVNPAMCQLMGRARDDVIGRSAFEFFAGEDLLTLHDELERRRDGSSSGYEIGLRRPDGSVVPCFNHATPIYDTQGQRIGSVGLWTDLTQPKQAEYELRTYEAVANSITDAVSVIDESGTYRMVNDAWCRMTGRLRAQVIGRRSAELYPFVASEERQRERRLCLEQNAPRSIRSPLPGLGDGIFETTYYPYLGQGTRSVVIVTRDVSEQEANRRALATSAEYLSATLNATADAIFASDATDPMQPARFVNDQMLRMWGITQEEGRSLSPAGLMAHAMPLFVEPEAERARIDDIVRHNLVDETRVQLKDGRTLLRRCIVSNVLEHPLRVWSFRDVTVEEQATQALRDRETEIRQLLEAFPGHIAAIDAQGRYVYVNSKFAANQGLSRRQIIGRSIQDVLGRERGRYILDLMPKMDLQGAIVSEKHYPATATRAAKDVELTMVGGQSRADGSRLYYCFAIDITTRNQAQSALMAARDDAERANKAKSQFLSQMSHELRTPMNAIIGFGQLLETDPDHPLLGEQQAYVQQILRSGRYLLNLINEVLDLGRIEAGRMEVDQAVVSVQAVLETCLNMVRPLAMERAIELPDPARIHCTQQVLADRLRTKQVLLNLLTNAIKYNRDGGCVSVDCRVDADHLVIEIGDQGRGLSDEQIQRLFQPFERLDAERTGIEGTGIGLALSKRLVEMMDGSIGVHSELGQGSRFWIRLPLAVQQTEPAALGAPSQLSSLDCAPADPLHTVLYIEDNPVNTILMEAMLSRLRGVRLITAALPRAGLVLARNAHPALILLDINLPGMDGYEVLRHLQADRRTAGIPVVAVSANALDADLQAGLAAGFADYLPKPLDMQQLLDTVRRLLGRHEDSRLSTVL